MGNGPGKEVGSLNELRCTDLALADYGASSKHRHTASRLEVKEGAKKTF